MVSWSRSVRYPCFFTRSDSCLSIASSFLFNLSPWSRNDSGFVYLLFWCRRFHFQFSFGLSYFLLFYWSFLTFLYLYLTISTTHFVGRQFGRFLRAGLSSNGSSESYSDSLSKLSSHQIPRCLDSEGTTTAKGLYVKSLFVFSHYAFRGVCALSALCTLAHHFGFGAELACSAAARVTSSLPISGLPFVLV